MSEIKFEGLEKRLARFQLAAEEDGWDLYTAFIEVPVSAWYDSDYPDPDSEEEEEEEKTCAIFQSHAPDLDHFVGRMKYDMINSDQYQYDEDEYDGADQPTPVTGLQNLWCWTCVDAHDRLFLVNIVKTVAGPTNS